MAEVVFYEKPGCINNTRQKAWLRRSGHTVIEKNLLTEQWRADRLRPFFGELPVCQWFNPTAPAITRGPVRPDSLTAQQALALMEADPLLIRRPLMEARGERMVGFEPDLVRRWIGLSDEDVVDVEQCQRAHESPCSEGGTA